MEKCRVFNVRAGNAAGLLQVMDKLALRVFGNYPVLKMFVLYFDYINPFRVQWLLYLPPAG
jgi:hypothetical protein